MKKPTEDEWRRVNDFHGVAIYINKVAHLIAGLGGYDAFKRACLSENGCTDCEYFLIFFRACDLLDIKVLNNCSESKDASTHLCELGKKLEEGCAKRDLLMKRWDLNVKSVLVEYGKLLENTDQWGNHLLMCWFRPFDLIGFDVRVNKFSSLISFFNSINSNSILIQHEIDAIVSNADCGVLSHGADSLIFEEILNFKNSIHSMQELARQILSANEELVDLKSKVNSFEVRYYSIWTKIRDEICKIVDSGKYALFMIGSCEFLKNNPCNGLSSPVFLTNQADITLGESCNKSIDVGKTP